MTRLTYLIFLLFLSAKADAQFTDSFSDGNYTDNPVWTANPEDFIVNDRHQLQSNNTTASSSFFITTPNTLINETEWIFWIKIDFNPSSANYVDIWLASALPDPGSTDNSGYFVRIGNTEDEISLYKKAVSGSATKLIDGADGILNHSSDELKIRVIHLADGRWFLMRDISGTGNGYVLEGSALDNSINTSSRFGILIKQSTASFFQKHYFDDFEVKTFNTPAALNITNVKATSPSDISIQFDQPLDAATVSDVTHYFISGPGNPASASIDPENNQAVRLTFVNSFTPNTSYNLIVNSVSDIFGNTIHDQLESFTYFKASRYDVVIDELFSDVSPRIGLPSQKFVELKNNAAFPVNLKNWKLSDENNMAVLPDLELLPDSFLIITTTGGLSSYQPYGKTVAVSGFPALNISGGQIILTDADGSVMHAAEYDLNSYGNELKKQGGFSLEMINTRDGCGGRENWTASNDVSGGTPGRKNSVDGNPVSSPDIQLMQVYLGGKDTLYLVFNKSVDSLSGATLSNYQLSDGLSGTSAETLPPFFDKTCILLSKEVDSNKVYSVTVSGISDCISGNFSKSTLSFGLPARPDSNDIVINEILFNPRPGGVDFVELYNRSSKIIDAGKLYLADRNSDGQPAGFVPLGNIPLYLFPNQFLLLTTSAEKTLNEFPLGERKAFDSLSSFPSFPDNAGFVLILDPQGNILDEVDYDSKWHFSLIKDPEGISLERIRYDGPSGQTNFHSAATTVNGTPGYKNSQSAGADNSSKSFDIIPEVFSPDNDGIDDYLTIRYNFPGPGYITNIKIFDAAGRMVRYLEKNSLSSTSGFYRWDGLGDKNDKLPQGIYIIYFESFNESGNKITHKKPVVLARKF